MYDFNQNYFNALAVPMSYSLDSALLKKNYLTALQQVHPDRFAFATDQEKRLAVQYTAFLNEAYHVLSSPIKRAIYLLECKGVKVDLERGPALSPEFLYAQIELREQLSEAQGDTKQLVALKEEVTKLKESDHSQLVEILNENSVAHSAGKATMLIAQLMFYDKLLTTLR